MSRRRASSADDVWRDALAYDRWFDTPWGHYATHVETRAVVRALGNVEGASAIDVGCGTGRLTAALHAAGAHIIGVDSEFAMLDVARQRIVPLAAGDALALPVRDNAVDIAVAVTVLEFVADPAVAMAELARIVCPGGRILVGALNPHSAWGLAHLHEFTAPPWNAARFLTRHHLRELGARYGRVKLHSALYVPGVFPLHELIGPVLERVGRALPGWGAFQTLVVETNRHHDHPATPTGTTASDDNAEPGARPRANTTPPPARRGLAMCAHPDDESFGLDEEASTHAERQVPLNRSLFQEVST